MTDQDRSNPWKRPGGAEETSRWWSEERAQPPGAPAQDWTASERREKVAGGGARNERNHRIRRRKIGPPRRGGRNVRCGRVGSDSPLLAPLRGALVWGDGFRGFPRFAGPPPANVLRPSGTLRRGPATVERAATPTLPRRESSALGLAQGIPASTLPPTNGN